MSTPTQIEASRAVMAAAQRLPTLFDLEDEAERLMATLEEIDDSRASLREAGFIAEDIEAELSDQLVLVDQMLLTKVESYVSVIRSLEAMADARKVEADRLRDRARQAEKHADWLKQRLLVHLQTTGRQRVETARFTLTVRQNPPHVDVLEAMLVPSEYQRTVITTSVDKAAILAAFKATGEIPSGVNVSRSESLSIR